MRLAFAALLLWPFFLPAADPELFPTAAKLEKLWG